jgi:murein L,D-transpeptidase YafK
MKAILSFLLFFSLSSACTNSQVPSRDDNLSLQDLIDSLEIPAEELVLHIDKSLYLLSVLADTQVIRQYQVVFGGNPVDDKLRQGDECTPEGSFRVLSRYPHRSWEKFIWIDYPNEASWRKHRQAKAEGIIPENAGIGGEIGIHGVPKRTDFLIDRRINWTLGCISLKNKDINDLYPCVREGTRVIIEK